MFVKIVRHATEELPYRDSVFECESFQLIGEAIGQPTSPNRHLILTRSSPGNKEDSLTISIDTYHEEVYIMNNNGKTIDYYVWEVEA